MKQCGYEYRAQDALSEKDQASIESAKKFLEPRAYLIGEATFRVAPHQVAGERSSTVKRPRRVPGLVDTRSALLHTAIERPS